MKVKNFKIEDGNRNQAQNPFIRSSGFDFNEGYFISISDGIEGLAARFENKEEYLEFIRQALECGLEQTY